MRQHTCIFYTHNSEVMQTLANFTQKILKHVKRFLEQALTLTPIKTSKQTLNK